MRNICPEENCFGCYACLNSCKKDAIRFVEKNGFFSPEIDESKCVNCGLCQKNCPALHLPAKSTPYKKIAYAAINNDKNVRDSSSSGGVFYALATNALAEGGSAYGAAWTDALSVKHIRIDDISQIKYLQGSKYLQSCVGDVYKNVKKDLESGKKVLFSGVPCQIAGLTSFLGKKYENLIKCEILCHGGASPIVFEEHLRYLSQAYGGNIKGVCFRHKTALRPQNINYVLESGKKILLEDPMKDFFYSGFQNGYLIRKSCFSCPFVGKERCADITLGDFWGLGKEDCIKKDSLTYPSLVLVYTECGFKTLEKIKNQISIEDKPLELAYQGNLCFRRHVPLSKWRNKFFNEFLKNGYTDRARQMLRPHQNIKSIIKKIVGRNATRFLIRVLGR